MSKLLLPHHIERRSPSRLAQDAVQRATNAALDRGAMLAAVLPVGAFFGIVWMVIA